MALRCLVCGDPLAAMNEAAGTHPMCDPKAEHGPVSDQIKADLTEIILWADKTSERSRQANIGPSELGTLCDRRIAYRLAGIPPVNRGFDPWPAIVGTAVHAWLEKAVNRYQEAHGLDEWRTEVAVHPDDIVSGHLDLYNARYQAAIDHKTAGADMMKQLHRGALPPPGYVTQVQLYGYGLRLMGFDVQRVALVFYPRAGWIKDIYVWSGPYDPEVAAEAIDRPYRIGRRLIELEEANQQNPWNLIDAAPDKTCAWCPWFSPRDAEHGADETGCPGTTGTAQERWDAAQQQLAKGLIS